MSRNPKFARSDIPYKDRLLMSKYRTIAQHRDDAAATALKIACVALSDTEGLGYTRLCRFADRLRELLEEYYKDPEIESAHLIARLRQLGFTVTDDGRMFKTDEEE